MEPTGKQLPAQPASKKWVLLSALLFLCVGLVCTAGVAFAFLRERPPEVQVQAAGVTGRQQVREEIILPTPTGIPASPTALAGQSDRFVPPGCRENAPSADRLTSAAPLLSPISFSTRQDEQGWPLDAAAQFTTVVSQVQALFAFTGMRNGLPWERVWYFGDEEMYRGQGVWDAGPQDHLTVYVRPGEGGFVPGRYQLEIYVAGQMLSRGSFLMVSADIPTAQPVQVAYTVWQENRPGINLLNLETGDVSPLVDFARSPAWSPDMVGLIFYGQPGIQGGTAGLWVLNMNRQQTYQLNRQEFSGPLVWSPHRPWLATAAGSGESPRLLLWNLDRDKGYPGPPGQDPAWSPEGLRLAYRGCNDGRWSIKTVQVISNVFNISSIRPLTRGDDSQPAWSRDGQRIAFVRRQDGNRDIYTVAANGTGLARLTRHPADDTAPAWTPDNRLLFRSNRDGRWAIYIMDADGQNPRLLVDAPAPPDGAPPDRPAVGANIRLVEPTPTPPPRPRVQVPPGKGVLVVSNLKNNDEMTFTINNQEHKIPPFQYRALPLDPGHYTWTASWPARVSRTGIADIVAGQVAYPVVER